MSADDWTIPVDPAAGAISRANYITYAMQNVQALYNAIVGDAQATNEVIHRHLTDTYANIPAAGEAGRRFYATDLCCELLDDGTSWLILPPPLEKCDYFYDDFVLSPGGTDTADARWRHTIDDATGAIGIVDDDDSLCKIHTGTVANKRAVLSTRSGTNGHYAIGANRVPAIVEFKLKQNQTAGVKYVGLTSNIQAYGGDPTDGLYFRQLGGAVNWFAVSRSGGVDRTTGDVGNQDTDFHIWRIIIEGTGAVSFWFDGSQVGTDHTANLPSANLYIYFYIETGAALDRVMQMDYVQMIAARA